MDQRRRDGDLIKKASSRGSRLLQECLMEERAKAMELLHAKPGNATKQIKPTNKPACSTQGISNKCLAKTPSTNGEKSPKNKENIFCEKNKESLDKNRTKPHELSFNDYVHLRQRKPIDISALMRSDSISFDSSTLTTPKDTDVSFHPAEMGGRSTLHICDSKSKQQQQRPVKLSVDEILASSFVADVRNSLSNLDSLNTGCKNLSTTSSCITDFSTMQKNPRPTTLFEDIPITLNKMNDTSIFSNFETNLTNMSNMVEENFASAEMMQSKLLRDEISWANERASIPKIMLSKEAHKKLKSYDISYDECNQSFAFNDPNFSLGRFFGLRSNDINEVVKMHSPPKHREPIALLSDDTITTIPEEFTHSYESVMPVIADMRYSQAEEVDAGILMTTNLAALEVRSHDSKDSGNATGKRNLLSLSAIDRILASGESVSKAAVENLSKVNKSNGSNTEVNEMFSSIMTQKAREAALATTDAVDLVKRAEQMSNIANIILENKENIQSHGRCSDSMADTLSFTESLLNTSIQNYRNSNAGQARLPLSPIPIFVSEPDNAENDADVEEFGTPVISPGRRKRFSKSPQNSSWTCALAGNQDKGTEKELTLSPNSVKSPITSEKKTTPVAAKTPVTVNKKKSLSSTRHDGDRSSPAGSSGTFTPTHNGHSVFELSPLSLSQSEAGNTVSKKSNSIRSWQCGAPMHTYSSNSLKSTDSTSTRSASQCSNNSEFNHRDGKMPIKATELELSWPSVKLRTDSHKSTIVKNTSDKRLVVRIETFGPGFKLISPESNNLTLMPKECRTIIVNFSPTMIGPAVGRLVFQPPRKYASSSNNNNANNTVSEVEVPLYAYGGHASIIIKNLERGLSGEPYVPMGEFCTLIRPVERSIEIYNKGPLMGFAAMFIEPTRLNIPEISNSIHIEPECALIEPNAAVTFRLVFQPKFSDLRNIRKFIDKVMMLATLRIMYGDEAIRQRIRQMQRLMTSDARKNIFGRSLDKLCSRFPGEQTMFPSGIFKDSSNVAQDLWTSISEQDVALTLYNNMLDETAAEISTIFTEGDNSILFRTMLVSSPSGQLETVEE